MTCDLKPSPRRKACHSPIMEVAQKFDEPTISKTQSKLSCRKLQDKIPARVVLYIMSFTGFLVSFMMRTDINIAIVAMVRSPSRNSTDNTTTNASSTSRSSHCYVVPGNQSDDDAGAVQDDGEFEWDATTQSLVLGSFYWCYILSQVVGGVLTQKFGTKAVFGLSQLATAACSLLAPQAATLHYGAFIGLRCIQGYASGLTWPAMYALVGHWIPPQERSRFMSSFQGFSFGIGLTYPICGFLIANWGWRTCFYMTGSLGILWCIAWWFLGFDTPAEHPRITQAERRYIETNVGNTVVGSKGMRVPWGPMLTSLPAWSIGITTFGRIWVHYVFISLGPTYMKNVLGFSIEKNGMLSGAPFLCSYLSSVVFCYVADLLVTRKLMGLTNIRKMFTAMSQIIPGLLLLVIGYAGCDLGIVLFAWFLAVTLITAAYAGAMANVVDIAPNLAGPVLAFAQTIHMTASFLSPLAAGLILKDNMELETWRRVFWVAAAVACVTYLSFQVFGTAKIQEWNYPRGENKRNESSQPLKDEEDQIQT